MSSSNPDSFSQFDISNHEKDKLIGEVIRYILFKSEQISSCPIRREDLTQLISAKGYKQRNLPAYIINESKSKLSSIFGYDMVELQRQRPCITSSRPSQSQSQQQGDAKSYVILSQLPSDVYVKYVDDASSSAMRGLAFVVIAIVHLCGGKVTEENLWQHLKQLGVNETEENHPDFGSTKQKVEGLIQQRYLQKEKVNGPDGGTVVYYELAERALHAPVYDQIKDYVIQMVQKDGVSLDEED